MGCNYNLSLKLALAKTGVFWAKKHVCFGIKSGAEQWRIVGPLVIKCHNFDVECVDAENESL